MTEAPHWALLWVSASQLLPSEPPTPIQIPPPPPPPLLPEALVGLRAPRRRGRSRWRRGGGGGGGCAGTVTRGRLRSVSFSRWNGAAGTAPFTARRRNSKEWWWTRRVAMAGLCFPTGGFFRRLALMTMRRRRGVFVVDSRFCSPGSVAAVLDKIFSFNFILLSFSKKKNA